MKESERVSHCDVSVLCVTAVTCLCLFFGHGGMCGVVTQRSVALCPTPSLRVTTVSHNRDTALHPLSLRCTQVLHTLAGSVGTQATRRTVCLLRGDVAVPCGRKPDFGCSFEFEFRRRGNYFFEGFEFLVPTHHVAVNVHVLWPVCTHTIPFRMLWRP